MVIGRISNVKQLKEKHSKDKRKYNLGEKAFACTSNPLFFETLKGDKVATNEWFVNNNNELIYDIKNNKWVNMDMYENGESTVTKNIYYFEYIEVRSKSWKYFIS